MKTLTLRLEDWEHREWKVRAAENEETMQSMIRKCVQAEPKETVGQTIYHELPRNVKVSFMYDDTFTMIITAEKDDKTATRTASTADVDSGCGDAFMLAMISCIYEVSNP